MSNKKITLLIILVFIGGIISGFVVGVMNGYMLKDNIDKIFNKKTEAAEKNITKLPTANNIAIPSQVLHITGTISEIKDNQIIVKSKIIIDNTQQDGDYTVNLDENTKYKKFNIAEENNDGIDFDKSELKNNDTITVLSSEDVKNKTEFTAKQINIYTE